MECRGVETARERPAAGGLREIVRPGQTRDGIQEDHNIPLVLHEALRTLDRHLRHALVMIRELIERRVDDLHVRSLDRLFDIRDFLRPLVDEQDDKVDFRIVDLYRLRDLLDKGRLTGFRRGDDHAALSLSDGTHQVHDAHRDAAARLFQTDPLIREDRRHILKIVPLCRFVGRHAVDGLHVEQRTELFALRPDADVSHHNVAGL